jgi:tetratricopeptide (TPR) repeat protein
MAISCYPKFSSAYHNRGTALYATRRFTDALADLLAACDLDPVRPESRNTLGDIYFDQKNYDKAVEQYRVAIKLDPRTYIPYYSIGLVMKAQGNEAESRRWIERSKAIRGRYEK